MRGTYTALITPFAADGTIDEAAYRKIIRAQADAGIDGVVVCGTTGESPTLTPEEKKRLIHVTLEEGRKRSLKTIAGTGTNSTRESVEFSKWASDQGVDGVLVVTPYYNKPSQAGLELHYRAVADAVACEVILYNVPGRSGVSLTPKTVAVLASHPRIRSIKEATGNVAFAGEILDALAQAGRAMDVLAGDDATYLALLNVGAVGVVSVASHVCPRAIAGIQAAHDQGDAKAATALHRRFFPVFRDLFVESNPVPVKYALAKLGQCGAAVRLPLAELSAESRVIVEQALARAGISAGTPA